MAVPMAEVLSIAQPTIDTVPETAAFGAGESILTLGGPLGAPLETVTVTLAEPTPGLGISLSVASRSGERRVGKECRSWWSPHHLKKNKHASRHHRLGHLHTSRLAECAAGLPLV